jgi:tRNA A37 threonylcarbamoyladenosine dehydratase
MNHQAILRLGTPHFDVLRDLVLSRYPDREWACFARFGWRETASSLVCTLADLDPPLRDDLDAAVSHVRIDEQYSLRIALAAERHSLGVGVIHSHPRDCAPLHSVVDDDMDAYYSRYFADFAKDRPYLSLILSEVKDTLYVHGRVFWRNEWLRITRVTADAEVDQWCGAATVTPNERTARLQAAFGADAAARLHRATVAVIGAGGTGSAAIEVLARAGVGRLIVVDPDRIEESNLERVHGSTPKHAAGGTPKVVLAREHIRTIDPDCQVEAYIGSLPQEDVIDAVVTADAVIGCTDQQHSRLAISDIANRYLIPCIDTGVSLEGNEGRVSGQIIQLVHFSPRTPCILCRNSTDPLRVAQELMTPEERQQRRTAALTTGPRGDNGGAYWRDMPQLNTVGYLTTIAGAMGAGYIIGWITRRFHPPFEALQMNLGAPYLDVTNVQESADPSCACQRVRGMADQGIADAFVSAPSHWPQVARL